MTRSIIIVRLWRNNRTALSKLNGNVTFSFASVIDQETRKNICYTNMLPVEMFSRSIHGLSSSDGLGSFTYGANASDSSNANSMKSTKVQNPILHIERVLLTMPMRVLGNWPLLAL